MLSVPCVYIGADDFSWWSTGSDGPCSPTTGICNTKPNERFGDHRFNAHQLRWAFFVVKQNAVRIKHIATGLEFLALIPFHNMIDHDMPPHIPVPSNPHKQNEEEMNIDGSGSRSNGSGSRSSSDDENNNKYDYYMQNICRLIESDSGSSSSSMGLFDTLDSNTNSMESSIHGGVAFELDGSITIRTAHEVPIGGFITLIPENISDTEFFMRYLTLPCHFNPHNEVKMALPGAIPKGSKFHYCMKGTTEERNRDECRTTFKSESMFWKSKVLGEWREAMNLPPRLQELRMW